MRQPVQHKKNYKNNSPDQASACLRTKGMQLRMEVWEEVRSWRVFFFVQLRRRFFVVFVVVVVVVVVAQIQVK